ncbi:MAG: hypothetical protein LKG25_08515 [Prevotella sp.]|jgi:hypothetical protein|nr:hypothetical protein [Prevotella sp.]MCI1282618.1 hypothetical protein [Prevotella sp.]
MEIFNFKRFLRLLKWRILDRRTLQIFILFTLCGLIYVLLPGINSIINYGARPEYLQMCNLAIKEHVVKGLSERIFYVFLYSIILSFALIFYGTYSKIGSIEEVLLPASRMEKFISRWVVCVFGALLSSIVVFLITDILQYIYYYFTLGNQACSLASSFFKKAQYDPIAYIWAISVGSFLLFCGSIYHRYTFILTGVSVLIFMGIMQLTLFSNGWNATRILLFSPPFTILCYLGSYRAYAHLQTVRNKWLNL